MMTTTLGDLRCEDSWACPSAPYASEPPAEKGIDAAATDFFKKSRRLDELPEVSCFSPLLILLDLPNANFFQGHNFDAESRPGARVIRIRAASPGKRVPPYRTSLITNKREYCIPAWTGVSLESSICRNTSARAWLAAGTRLTVRAFQRRTCSIVRP